MKNPLTKIKEKLWQKCKEFVRLVDGKICVSCGKYIDNPSAQHTGHFIAESVCPIELKYSPFNLHVQCATCNYDSGNIPDYERFMIDCYGEEFVQELKNQSGRTLIIGQQKPDVLWYENKIKIYDDIIKTVHLLQMQGSDQYAIRKALREMRIWG